MPDRVASQSNFQHVEAILLLSQPEFPLFGGEQHDPPLHKKTKTP
jgi:hypothetical protein